MTDTKLERLGLRGILALFESGLRLLGGANTTGAIASGAAFHAFAGTADAQNAVKVSGLLFLFGIFAFIIAYVCWFLLAFEVEQSLRDPTATEAEKIFWSAQIRGAEEYRRTARRYFMGTVFIGLVSFTFLMAGFGKLLSMAVHLALD